MFGLKLNVGVLL